MAKPSSGPREARASATIRTTKEVRPRRPKVDRGEEIEQLTREMFKSTVERWCKENLGKDEQPNKEVKGNVVDNLAASFTSAIETLVDAATDSYLSTAIGDEDIEEVECPECENIFEVPDDYEDGNKLKCPKCKEVFELDEDEDEDDDEDEDGDEDEVVEGD